MNNWILYFTTILIWGSTWLAIQYQLGEVTPLWSVAYRFFIAGVLLLLYCIVARKRLTFTTREHIAMLLQGIFLFSINYFLYYIGSEYLISGVVAVTFAIVAIMNIINARLFFKTPISLPVVVGSSLGLLGLGEVFWSEIKALATTHDEMHSMFIGLAYCVLATFIASLGNMISKRNQGYQIPILQSNGFAMLYGSLFTALVAMMLRQPMTFDFSTLYVSSLLYLALIGSILAFGCYLKLLGQIGPERASYVFIVIPIISMLLSTVFEGFEWSTGTFVGIVLIIIGNSLVLSSRRFRGG